MSAKQSNDPRALPATKHIEKRIKFHDRACSANLYSGDRHCSCGRDLAEQELAALVTELKRLQAIVQPELPL